MAPRIALSPRAPEPRKARLWSCCDWAPRGGEQPAVRADGTVYSLASLTAEIDGTFLAADGVARAREALERDRLTVLPGADELRIGSPIARPTAIVCIGQNYVAHAAESGAAPPERPIIFLKHPNTIIGPNDPVTIPPGSTTTDWEVELAIVIGTRTSLLASPDDALSHIAGWTLANDVSDRRSQIELSGGQWSKGKCAPTFCPLGPALIPTDALDATGLRLRSWVNGGPRQDSRTGDMIFSAAQLVHDISQYMTLDPGDLILTGTPGGCRVVRSLPVPLRRRCRRAGDRRDRPPADHLSIRLSRCVSGASRGRG